MLTFASIIEATRQMGAHGEERMGALDHLPKKFTGPRRSRNKRTEKTSAKGSGAGVRRWDEKLGNFVYDYD